LVTSIAIGVSCCTSDKENENKKENVKVEYDIFKIKGKRIEYGK